MQNCNNHIAGQYKSILNYYGPCSMQVISSMGKFITDNIQAKSTVRTKLYKVLVELTFNVLKYSTEIFTTPDNCSIGIGTLHIYEDENYYYCQTKNRILKEQSHKLDDNCNIINALNHLELRQKKEQLRKAASLLDTGAHIGLISVKLFSENCISCDFSTDEQNETYFSLTACIFK
jgi:hypothetical protein